MTINRWNFLSLEDGPELNLHVEDIFPILPQISAEVIIFELIENSSASFMNK